MQNTKVLIVDDHNLFRKGLRKLLENMQDVDVIGEAQNGVEAIKQVSSLAPDVVLMDIAMPEMNGLEATSEIHRSFPSIAIILLTMYDNEEYLKQALQYGAIGYLLKDISTNELFLALQAAIKGEPHFSPAISRKIINRFTDGRSASLLPQSLYTNLSTREIEILRLLTAGKSNKIIADRLCISIKTVEKHRNNIMQKLDIHNIVDLVKYALKNGLAHL